MKTIGQCVREQEARDHQEMLAKARRAASKARRAATLAEAILREVKENL